MVTASKLEIAGLLVACVLAATCVEVGTAFAAGTTVTPAEARFNVALSNASFKMPLGTVICSEGRSSGSIPAAPGNADTDEGGAVGLPFETPTLGGCSFPGASSVSVASLEAWSATADGFEEANDTFLVAVPERGLRITIVNSHGTCTILAGNEPGALFGEWTDGSGGGASTATLGGSLTFTASGTCVAHCSRLESTGSLDAEAEVNVTNATERETSITF